MNSVEFHVQLSSRGPDDPLGGPWPIVHLVVDGQSFLDIIRNLEKPFAVAEGHPDLAGGYEGLPAASVLPPSRHFLGAPNEVWLKYGEKVSLYECVCGCPGCWPFLARVVVNSDSVCWSEFEQPHRGPKSVAGWWRYDALGPFVFDRGQYESHLACAAEELRNMA
jgi:hypothetical protein